MTTATLTHRIPLLDFLKLPDLEAGKRELLEGELIELPPTTAPHNRIANRIVSALRNYLKREGDLEDRACMEAGFEISAGKQSWFKPDVALLHPEQLNNHRYYEGAPLIAIEVISPSNKARDIDRKRRIYLAAGSQEVWIVYPETRTVTIETSEGQLTRHDDTIVSALLPGFLIKFDELFQHP